MWRWSGYTRLSLSIMTWWQDPPRPNSLSVILVIRHSRYPSLPGFLLTFIINCNTWYIIHNQVILLKWKAQKITREVCWSNSLFLPVIRLYSLYITNKRRITNCTTVNNEKTDKDIFPYSLSVTYNRQLTRRLAMITRP